MSRNQKKMKEDNRRLGLTLEQMSHQLSEALECRDLTEASFRRLAVETGRGEDFRYEDDAQVRADMMSEHHRLRAEVEQLEEQVRVLEMERLVG